MNSDAYRKRCDKIIFDIKHNDICLLPKNCILPNGNTIAFNAITEKTIRDSRTIALLAKWREKANPWFPKQFTVTFDSTKTWAKEQLLEKKDRVLFFVTMVGEKNPFGHVGLYRFDYKKRSAEIDNVIRGLNSQKSKGGMFFALQSLMEWSFKTFLLHSLTLSVFSDNKKALLLYSQAGFIEISRIPLRKEIHQGDISWLEYDKKKYSDIQTDRENIKMIYIKK